MLHCQGFMVGAFFKEISCFIPPPINELQLELMFWRMTVHGIVHFYNLVISNKS